MSQHISLPIRKGLRGFFATVSREDAIKENIRAILFVEPGERFMRSDLGTPIRSQLWDPADTITISSMITHLRRQIQLYEKRIQLEDVRGEVTVDDATQTVVVAVQIEYIILPSRTYGSVLTGIQLKKGTL